MKLCKHLEPIYQNEIRKGNSIVYVWRQNKYFCVALKNMMEDYSSFLDVKFRIETDTHYPLAQEYSCPQCFCYICGPCEKDQYGWYKRDSFTQFCEKAVATLDTIEIEDEVWNTMSSTMVPKMIGFKDRY